jgi:hypothetical protein
VEKGVLALLRFFFIYWINFAILKKVYFLSLFVFIFQISIKAQHCDAVAISMPTVANVDFTFDSFAKYIGGITQNGATQIRVAVSNNITLDPDCRWALSAIVDNNPFSGTPANEWESLVSYTSSGAPPTLDMLEIRVRNACNTPLTGQAFVNTLNNNGDALNIIDFNGGITIPAGSCATNVNGPGSYLNNYNEYNFTIDYRITPGLSLKSGIYQISVKFLIIEEL